MRTKVAINGFGRIGRNAFKIAFRRADLEIVGINDLSSPDILAHLLKYDSSYHNFNWYKTIEAGKDCLIVDGVRIPVFSKKDPAELPWKSLGVGVVLECTGFFTEPKKARLHIKAGAKKVLVSAPFKLKGAAENGSKEMGGRMVILGVNDDELSSDDLVISNGSCTTNCVAPVLRILEDSVGAQKSMMTTVHSYTNSQSLQDAPNKDFREARAAAENIVPTATGAAKAVGAVDPLANGHFDGLSIRVPTPIVSLIDLTVITKHKTSKEDLKEVFRAAAKSAFWQGLVSVSEGELVSSDFIGNSNSAIVDLPLIDVVDGNMVKVVAWYDNEWGYSNRLVELCAEMGRVE